MEHIRVFLEGEITKEVIASSDLSVTEGGEAWGDEELVELLKPEKALTGKQMVEQNYIGGWEDMGIVDGAAWVNQQKALRNAKRKKKLE